MSKVRYSQNKSNVSRVNTNSRESFSKTNKRFDKLADQISTLVKIVSNKVVTLAKIKAVEEPCVTCGGAYAYYNCPNTDSNQSSVCAAMGTYNQVAPLNRVSNHMAPPGFAPVQNSQNSGFFQNQVSTSGTLPSNTIPNPKCEINAILTRSGVAYEGLSIPTNPSPKKVVERETKETTDKEQTNFQGSTAHIQPPVNPIPISEPVVPKTLLKPNILYPSRLNYQKFHEKALNQREKNDKLFELAKIPLNENCSAMLLKKLPEKLGDPGKFLIPCDFPGMDDSFEEELRLKKSNHPSSGSTTPLSDSRPSLTSFETSDSLLEEFADELALLASFPPGNEDVDFKADLREIELFLNRDPSTDFSPKITIDPNPDRFINEPALVCLPPPGDDDDDKENTIPLKNKFYVLLQSHPDINPLFNEILEDVESEDSNVSNFDEPVLLNTPLFDKDECFDPGGDIDEIDVFLAIDVPSDIMDAYNDSEGDVLEILHNTTHNLSPEVFFDHEPQCFKDEPELDNVKHMVKVFDPGIWEKIFSPSYVRLSSKDRHYLSFTIVIQILLTYPVNFLFSFGSEDTIFDPGIFAYIFYSYKPVLSHRSGTFICFNVYLKILNESPMEIFSSTCSIPMDN
ncbi:hypothetical protein Tco_1273350 [Tanacetum coccineum]